MGMVKQAYAVLKNRENQSMPDYEFLDCGDKRRLERFSNIIVDRPAPQAVWPKSSGIVEWNFPNARFDSSSHNQAGWLDLSLFPKNWQMQIDDITVKLRPSCNNQVGIFPEQLLNWRWVTRLLQKTNRPVRLLNGFAYTGVATLIASAVNLNVEVCHVDGAKASVSWARKNSVLSGLDNSPIRWIVDDVIKFLEREVKRGRQYDAFVLDPPAFGRGQKSSWQLSRDLPYLLDLVNQLLSDNPLFVILSCHSPELTSRKLANMLEKLDAFRGYKGEAIDLTLFSNRGNDLTSSICGRIERSADINL